MEIKTLAEMSGKRIESITGKENDETYFICSDSEYTKTMILLHEHQGTYSQNWIVCLNAEGQETARHNAMYIETINWLEEEPTK